MMCEQHNLFPYQSTADSDRSCTRNGFDLHRPLKTRGGETVALLTTNGPGAAPIIGIIFPGHVYGHGAGKLHRWNYSGKSYDATTTAPRGLDLERNVVRGFDWDKPFKTCSGLFVQMLTRSRRGERKFVGLVFDTHRGSDKVVLYYPNGMTRDDGRETEWDLVNI